MTTSQDEKIYRTSDLAAELGCSDWKVLKAAKAIGAGMDLGGRAGFRFTEADRQAIYASLRPSAPVAKRRKRRAA